MRFLPRGQLEDAFIIFWADDGHRWFLREFSFSNPFFLLAYKREKLCFDFHVMGFFDYTLTVSCMVLWQWNSIKGYHLQLTFNPNLWFLGWTLMPFLSTLYLVLAVVYFVNSKQVALLYSLFLMREFIQSEIPLILHKGHLYNFWHCITVYCIWY